MLFNSVDFLIFFPIVVLVYFVIPNKVKQYWLLVASYYFYMCWNAKYVLLILTSTIITYLSGLVIGKIIDGEADAEKSAKRKKGVVAISFAANLGILFYFKYIGFTLGLISACLSKVHIVLSVPEFDVLLPVGISFYTFQALSYTMDVYRSEIKPEKNFFKYALFVSFFPQLVAGPIERSKNLLKQIDKPARFSFDNLKEGLLLMLWGFFLKLCLADRISIFVDAVYGDWENYKGVYLIVATVLFAIQIYCDFAGYSTIAMGSAKILGITLMDNFDAPYLATSVSDFWRRWHISLTSWFKDYLYIPLGGSRKGQIRKYINKMIVFLVSGLWHGAQLTFVVWGGLNGLYQVIGEVLMPIRKKTVSVFRLNTESFGHKLIQAIVTFVLVDISWVFFRAESIKSAIHILWDMFSERNPWVLFDGSLYTVGLDQKNFCFMIIAIVVLLIVDGLKVRGISIRNKVLEQDYWFRCLFIACSVLVILVFGKYGPAYDAANFIYFQF